MTQDSVSKKRHFITSTDDFEVIRKKEPTILLVISADKLHEEELQKDMEIVVCTSESNWVLV